MSYRLLKRLLCPDVVNYIIMPYLFDPEDIPRLYYNRFGDLKLNVSDNHKINMNAEFKYRIFNMKNNLSIVFKSPRPILTIDLITKKNKANRKILFMLYNEIDKEKLKHISYKIGAHDGFHIKDGLKYEIECSNIYEKLKIV